MGMGMEIVGDKRMGWDGDGDEDEDGDGKKAII